MLKAFESQIRVCLFEYRQIREHFVSSREGRDLFFWAFKAKDVWFLWLEDPGVSVISLWEVTPPKTTVHTEQCFKAELTCLSSSGKSLII